MTRILLVATPFWDTECPAFSLVQLASYLKASYPSARTRILDFNLLAPELGRLLDGAPAGIHPPLFHFGDAWAHGSCDGPRPQASLERNAATLPQIVEVLADAVLRCEFDVLGITISLANWFLALPLLRRLRRERRGALMVAGGPHISLLCEVAAHVRLPGFCQYMEQAASVIVLREGEQAFREIVERHAAGQLTDTARVDGTVRFAEGRMVPGPPTRFISDLNLLPSPDYEDFGLESTPSFESVHVELSRGCPHHCEFCSDPGYWQAYRRKGPGTVERDLKAVRGKTHSGVLRLSDSGFYPWLPDQEAILDSFRRLAPPVTWSAYTSIRGMTPRYARRFYESGCRLLSFGLESGDEELLRAMGKPPATSKAVEVLGMARDHGLLVEASLVVGFPGETEQSLRRTLQLVDTVTSFTRLKVFEFMPAVYSRFVTAPARQWTELFSDAPRADAVCVGPSVFYHPPRYAPLATIERARREFADRGIHVDFFPRGSDLRRAAQGVMG